MPTLRARLRHIQRLGFPPDTASGRAGRADYRLSDVYAVALAFRLVDAYVPPAAAITTVSSWWPELARPFLASAAAVDRRRWAGQPTPLQAETLLVIRPRALGLLADGGAGKRTAIDQGGMIPLAATPDTLAGRIAQAVDGLRSASIVVDVAALHEALMEALEAEEEADAPWFASGLEEMHLGGGWSDCRAVRGAMPVDEKGRINGRERFFARTRHILAGVASRADGYRPVPLSEAERVMLAYLAHPSPLEDWKRGWGPAHWKGIVSAVGPGTGRLLDALSAVLASAGVPEGDLPGVRSSTLLSALLPAVPPGAPETSPMRAFLDVIPAPD
jgi:hypothetical protein